MTTITITIECQTCTEIGEHIEGTLVTADWVQRDGTFAPVTMGLCDACFKASSLVADGSLHGWDDWHTMVEDEEAYQRARRRIDAAS